MLAVDGLRFRYRRGGDELFDGLTHEFEVGKVTALTGPSGRGKSTLLYLIGLMLKPSAGEIRMDGTSAADLPDDARSRIRATTMGFVFQDSALDPTRTILDAVIEPGLYAGRTSKQVRAGALELLERTGLSHRATHRPGQISGGQAQRVALCRALVGNPAIILADEPTGNLDEDNSNVVLGALRDAARQDRTVIIATHDPRVVEQSDAVVRL